RGVGKTPGSAAATAAFPPRPGRLPTEAGGVGRPAKFATLVFFDALAPRTRPTNLTRPGERPAQFPSPAGDGIAVQSGDTGQPGNAATAVLAGEEAHHQPAGAFIGSREKAIEGTMLSGDLAVGVLSAGRARTSVDGPPALLGSQTFLGDHRTLP